MTTSFQVDNLCYIHITIFGILRFKCYNYTMKNVTKSSGVLLLFSAILLGSAISVHADTPTTTNDASSYNYPMGYFAEVQSQTGNAAAVPSNAPKPATDLPGALTQKSATQVEQATADITEKAKQQVVSDTSIQKTSVKFDENPTVSPMIYQSSVSKIQTLSTSAPDNLSSADSSLPRKDAVDIASYQSWMTQNDFNQLKAQGVKTIVVKLTQATNYINPYAKSQIQMAKNAGLNVAVYHFSVFGGHNTSQATANAEATAEGKYFATVAKQYGLPANTVMINDAEYTDGTAGLPVFDWTQASQQFANAVKSQGYANVKYYTSKSWAVDYTGQMEPRILGAKNGWIAQYLYGKPSASNLQNTNFGAWQYSSQMYFQNLSNNYPVDVSIDYSNLFNAPATTAPVYRMYNPNSGEHFYTENTNEVLSLQKAGWNYEGVGWNAPLKTTTTPVYRVYNPNKGGYHFYTTSAYEKDQLVKKGWRYEGISFRSAGSVKVYRAYNPNNGMHNYTINSYEQNALIKAGWKNEGIGWYGS